MNKHLLLLLPLLFLLSCSSTKVELEKHNIANHSVSLMKYTYHDFQSPFMTLEPEITYSFATTESQKLAAKSLNYVTQNRFDDAADTICKALVEKDILEVLWKYFPKFYHSCISYNWNKLEEYVNVRDDIKNYFTDSSFAFYKDKPKFNIDFKEDSVVIPIKLKNNVPAIKIKINGKYYTFLIDTGCNQSIIGKNIANKNDVIYDNKEKNISTIDECYCLFGLIA